ncbi:MAG: hypoxanthine phosphoribosyltransferase [Planctomycetota bacterium]
MRVLLNEHQLQDGVATLARTIDRHYDGRPLTILGVMTGSIVLFADLIRQLSMPLRVSVIRASSYRGGTHSSDLLVDTGMMIDVEGRDVLLVDDIFDTGKTMQRLVDTVAAAGAASVSSAVLLHKLTQHDVTVRPDFVAFEIPDEFVVGYGLDYQEMYRNLPYLAVLEPDDLRKHETQQ